MSSCWIQDLEKYVSLHLNLGNLLGDLIIPDYGYFRPGLCSSNKWNTSMLLVIINNLYQVNKIKFRNEVFPSNNGEKNTFKEITSRQDFTTD